MRVSSNLVHDRLKQSESCGRSCAVVQYKIQCLVPWRIVETDRISTARSTYSGIEDSLCSGNCITCCKKREEEAVCGLDIAKSGSDHSA